MQLSVHVAVYSIGRSGICKYTLAEFTSESCYCLIRCRGLVARDPLVCTNDTSSVLETFSDCGMVYKLTFYLITYLLETTTERFDNNSVVQFTNVHCSMAM